MIRLGIAILAAACAGSTALAQGLVSQKALSADAAQAVAQGALEKCRADGYHVSVSVVDASGMLKAFVRDDGTGPHTIALSRRKAYTAITFKRTTGDTAKAWAANPPAPNIEGTVGLAGGVPIKAGNEFIGAVGVSGAPGGEKDEACSNAGIAKIADHLK
jgi:uncharacterized protein GlcG (DUF336 family)